MKSSLVQAATILSTLASASILPSPSTFPNSSAKDITAVAGTTGNTLPKPVYCPITCSQYQAQIMSLSISAHRVRDVLSARMMAWYVHVWLVDACGLVDFHIGART